MGKLREFLKIKKATEESNTSTNENKPSQEIQIQIEGDLGLFKNEKEHIIEGAEQLLKLGKAEDMEDAIIIAATMLRGLKFKEIQRTQDGITVIVLRETAQGRSNITKERDQIEL